MRGQKVACEDRGPYTSFRRRDPPTRSPRLKQRQKKKTHLHMSISGPYTDSPNNNSGDLYHIVTTIWVMFLCGTSYFLANPKSQSAMRPVLCTSTLLVLTSRWTNHRECTCDIADSS